MRRLSLLEAAELATRDGRRINAQIIDGGLGNGRSECSLSIGRSLVNGHVAVQQGLSSDTVYVPPERAAEVMVLIDDQPIGIVEVARLLGVMRGTVDTWAQRGVLPERDYTVGGRPAWAEETIREWARSTGRLPAARPEEATYRP